MNDIYLAPQVDFSDEENAMIRAWVNVTYDDLSAEVDKLDSRLTSLPHEDICSCLCTLMLQSTRLSNARELFQEVLEEEPEISDTILQVSATNAAIESIVGQLYLVLKNSISIGMQIVNGPVSKEKLNTVAAEMLKEKYEELNLELPEKVAEEIDRLNS